MIMRNIYNILLTVVVLLLSACHEPEYVNPTVERQGLTSLTAIFTSGPFVNQEMAKLVVQNEEDTRFVIQVPWFYPVTSDDETTPYMKNVRVQAELQENCFIEPALTVLDLTQENWFTYTNAQGKKTQICIMGERVKSSACELLAFSVLEPAISGVVDKNANKVSLISADDLSDCLAEAQISAHATISPDPSVTPLNYNEAVEFTVTAHNGIDKKVYQVVKEIPAKIPAGFNKESVEHLFDFDPVATLGFPPYNESVAPSMAAINGHLVVCFGNGDAPVYLNRITGVKLGSINVGSAVAGSITSDEANHMLIVNHAAAGGVVNIYKTSSVTEAPVLFHSFKNETDLPMGTKMKVIGNVDADAAIVITNEGIEGVTASSKFTRIQVKNGVVESVRVIDMSSTGVSWGSAPFKVGTVVAGSVDPNEGHFESNYEPSKFTWVKVDGNVGASLSSDLSGWALNPHCLDSKCFNNTHYVALFVTSHFPHWGNGPQLYLYDINDKSKLTGDNVSASPALALANRSLVWYQKADAGTASGDVLLAPTADGFKLYVYYYDHNSGVIGAYVADCIAK